DYLRAGLSYYTGTNYSMTDEFSSQMWSKEFDPGQEHSYTGSPSQFSYNVRVPSRLSGGFSVIIPKLALFSFDMERVDYSSGKLSSDYVNFNSENQVVSQNFIKANNFKFGTEWLYGPYRFRAGYAYYGSPLKADIRQGYDLSTSYYTLGLGYRNRNGFFMDLAAIYRVQTSFYTPYTLDYTNRESYTALMDSKQVMLNLSVGSVF